jgi:hypothetical protein
MVGDFFTKPCFARQEVLKISEHYPWTLTRYTTIHVRQSVMSHETKRSFRRTKDIEQQQEKKEEILSTLLVIKDMRRVPKRLKTGEEHFVEAVKVKVKSDDDNDKKKEEEEESSDNDNDEEQKDNGQEEQVAQPVGQVERPRYVPLRPKYILMDYNKSMGGGVIPKDKVLRPKNLWCYTKLDPVFWGENSIDRCPTYGVCWVCCSSGPTRRYCQMCKN